MGHVRAGKGGSDFKGLPEIKEEGIKKSRKRKARTTILAIVVRSDYKRASGEEESGEKSWNNISPARTKNFDRTTRGKGRERGKKKD